MADGFSKRERSATKGLCQLRALRIGVDPYERLSPYLSSRVVASGDDTKGGHYARLDNDLYLHPSVREISKPFLQGFDVWYLLFFNPEGSHATPPFGILGDLLTLHLGYDLSNPAGIPGRPEVRAAVRKARREFGLGRLWLTSWKVKPSHPLPAGAPRHWSRAEICPRPSRQAGPEGYDWPALGSQLLSLVDPIYGLLEMTRPTNAFRALEPR